MEPDTIDPIRDTARHQLAAAGMNPDVEGHIDAFVTGYHESQEPKWDNVRMMMVFRVDPAEPDSPSAEFPPHIHSYDLVPVTATGDMMAAHIPKFFGRPGKVRSAVTGAAYVFGWSYGKWEMTQ